MDVLILSAGRGTRMGQLTEITPKPLLRAGSARLIEHQITRLARAGMTRIVVNIAHLAEQFEPALGDGSRYGVELVWSREPPGALETGGGIRQAMDLMHGDVFAVVNGDVWTDLDYAALPTSLEADAFLVMVDNPDFHPAGDFWLFNDRVSDGWRRGARRVTFSGLGVYHRRLFASRKPGRFPLAPLLRDAMDANAVHGMHHAGRWLSVDTPDRLETVARWTNSGHS